MAKTWTSEEIYTEVVALLADAQGCEVKTISPTSDIVTDLGVEDSWETAHVVFMISKKFDLSTKQHNTFPRPQANTPYTVDHLCKLIAERIGVQWTAPEIAHA